MELDAPRIAAWHVQLQKTFGAVAQCPAVDRVLSYLKSSRGLRQVLSMMSSGTPLHGRSEQDVGISECFTLVRELKKIKANGTEASNSSIANPPVEGDNGKDSSVATPAEEIEEMTAGVMLVEAGDTDMDPVEKAISSAAESKMDGVRFFRKVHEVEASLVASVFPGWHVIFLVDCYTSRPKVCIDYLKKVKDWADAAKLSSFKVAVPVGKRFELLDKVEQNMMQLWPKMPIFTVTLHAQETQTLRQRNNYVIVVVVGKDPSNTTIPVSAPLLKCRAKRQEALRLRCMDRGCSFRSVDEKAKLCPADQTPDPCCEFEPDDLEMEDEQPFEEDSEGLEAASAFESSIPGEKRGYLVDLWTFARPESWYTGLLSFLGASASQMFFLITTSGHPSAIVAGREMGLSVMALIDRVSTHSSQHGEAIAIERFKDRCADVPAFHF